MPDDKNPTHVANRRFTASGKDYNVGDKVDASSWKWTRQMEAQRYISPYSPPTPAAAPSKKTA